MTYKETLKNLLLEAIELISTVYGVLNDAENWLEMVQPSIERVKSDSFESVDITNIFYIADMINQKQPQRKEFYFTLDQALEYLRGSEHKVAVMPENGTDGLYFFMDNDWGDLYCGSEQAEVIAHPNWEKFITDYDSVMFKPIFRP